MSNDLDRVIVYVDAFNLYFGMLESGLNNCKWLDINKLVSSCLSNNQRLIEIKYFTSRVTNNPEKHKRQSTYLEALETTHVKIIYGLYKSKKIECQNCGHLWQIANEKMTDVNIAMHLLIDAYEDLFDTAILISGDSDLVPPIRSVHNRFVTKSVSVFFPPGRHNLSVAAAAKGSMILGRKKLNDNQFPIIVSKQSGFKLVKPTSWP